jgi:adenylate cyclase
VGVEMAARGTPTRERASPLARPVRQTFLFADLAGFTALTVAGGDELAAEVATDFHARVERIASEHGATVVKTLGDGLMARVEDPMGAVRLGVLIATQVGGRGGLPPVRVGIHTGEAVEREGDWFGSAVNVAAGLVWTACKGEVLVSESTRAAAGPPPGIELRAVGPSTFKDGAEPVEVYSATPRPAYGEAEGAVDGGTDDCPPERPCPTRC